MGIRLRCQHYFAACRVVARTDLILTMPGNYARVANRESLCGQLQAIFAAHREITGRPRPKLAAIATADYPTPARRPADSTLDSGLFQATFGAAPIAVARPSPMD